MVAGGTRKEGSGHKKLGSDRHLVIVSPEWNYPRIISRLSEDGAPRSTCATLTQLMPHWRNSSLLADESEYGTGVDSFSQLRISTTGTATVVLWSTDNTGTVAQQAFRVFKAEIVWMSNGRFWEHSTAATKARCCFLCIGDSGYAGLAMFERLQIPDLWHGPPYPDASILRVFKSSKNCHAGAQQHFLFLPRAKAEKPRKPLSSCPKDSRGSQTLGVPLKGPIAMF
ncbi:hypothetical protein B0H14DRAFT_2639475 [Mycena olivaceomarginata]|nr:hypothetical protein B0H14DRAFT_2639475 [Mycena olivaceomarginata]